MRTGVGNWSMSAWVVLGGMVAAVVGAALVVSTVQSRTATFGWFAYAPLAADSFSFGERGPGAGELFGYFLAEGGLLVLGWSAGYRWSPRAPRTFLPGLSRTARTMVLALAGCASLAVLAGGAILLAAPPSAPLFAPEPATAEMSVAYSSSLHIAFDAEPEPLLLPGFGLLLGGLLVSATTLGHRAGQPRRRADGRDPDGNSADGGPDAGSDDGPVTR